MRSEIERSASRRNDVLILAALAALKLVFHLLTNRGYGWHRDELATLDDACHLAWGYVAYPPLTPFIGRIGLALFGPSTTGLRALAALAQSIVMIVAGLMARRMGGSRAAQLLTAGAVAIAPISLAASSLFQYVTFDYLWVVLLAYFVMRLIDDENQRWWLAIGAVIGLAALTKYTIAFFLAGLAAAVFLTPLRRSLARGWLWAGAALSMLIALPNFVWQLQHHFISLDFLSSIHARDVRIGRAASFLPDQLLVATNPMTVPLWLAGLWVLLFTERGRRYRALAWMALGPFVLFLLARGRGYYMGPVYPPLLAAGAVELVRSVSTRSLLFRRTVWTCAGLLLAIGGSVALLIVPIAPLGSAWWRAAVAVNGDLVEEVGWPELTAEVARIHRSIPAQERSRVAIFCDNYGEAGAINLYGARYGLPQAISGVNSYWLRGYGPASPETIIVLGSNRKDLEEMFGEVTLAGHVRNPWQVRNEESERHPDIFLCRFPRRSFRELWPRLRSFG